MSKWSREEDELFETAIAQLNFLSLDHLFQHIAWKMPRKTLSEIKQHFFILVEDLHLIESNAVPLPNYKTCGNKTIGHPRKRRVPWNSEEHKLFLEGPEKYGKGDWKSISRYCVVTRTPSQVASHAQKYFISLHRKSKSHIFAVQE
ncbi:transcription factor SRM1-like [Mangifera indica]|uniref:transcription factor SRM1-like n=1 Tax=Mangifera indica TaxID=29780 RepID=UPI001CF9394D|nr:transcription factor SRM1-like [Mangifera indica]